MKVMDDDKVTIDLKALKALGAETRVNILKALGQRQKTQTELASELKMSNPAIIEHLDKLSDAGLVEKIDEGRKWKYYRLTNSGKKIIGKAPLSVIIVLALSLMIAFGSGLFLWGHASALDTMQTQDSAIVASMEKGTSATESAPMLAYGDDKTTGTGKAANQTVDQTANEITATAEKENKSTEKIDLSQLMPSIALLVLSLIIAGLSAGYLIKK